MRVGRREWVLRMKFINWIDHSMFYISVVMLCFISTIIALPMFDIYDRGIQLFCPVVAIAFGFLIALLWADEFKED